MRGERQANGTRAGHTGGLDFHGTALPASQRSVQNSRFNRGKSSIRKRARFLASGMSGAEGRNHVALHIRSLR